MFINIPRMTDPTNAPLVDDADDSLFGGDNDAPAYTSAYNPDEDRAIYQRALEPDMNSVASQALKNKLKFALLLLLVSIPPSSFQRA